MPHSEEPAARAVREMSRKKKKKRIDALAAAEILQMFLDSKKATENKHGFKNAGGFRTARLATNLPKSGFEPPNLTNISNLLQIEK
jgi:hypothetical protein